MLFVGLVLVFVALLLFYLYRQADSLKFTKTVLPLLILSIMANISLAQNYTQSLIPGANDGIGISNFMASWIITDSGWGDSWSVELFKKAYDTSMGVSLIVLLSFVVSMVMEKNRQKP